MQIAAFEAGVVDPEVGESRAVGRPRACGAPASRRLTWSIEEPNHGA